MIDADEEKKNASIHRQVKKQFKLQLDEKFKECFS